MLLTSILPFFEKKVEISFIPQFLINFILLQ